MLTIPASIRQIQADFAAGSCSSESLSLAYLERIAALDSPAGGLNSVSIYNPDALFQAQAADQDRAAGLETGPLCGIPVLVKANIGTGDGMPTTAGSLVLRDHYALRDSFLAARLRKAGAVLLGKTNMTEYANFMSYHMPSGYSSLGGQVRNPYSASQEPGGSSSGSAVAMAARLAGVCIGTETNASILWPSHVNGVVGLKPSIGLVSRTGIIPISRTLDTAGPIAASTEDAALTMNVIAGYDPEDPATHILRHRKPEDFTRYLSTDFLRGKRIGLYHADTFLTDQPQQQATDRILTLLQEAGAILEPRCFLREYPEIKLIEKYEFKASLNHYFSKNSQVPHTLREILLANEAAGSAALRYGQDRMAESEDCSGFMTERDYLDALLLRAQARRELAALMERQSLDAILCTGGITDIAPFTGFPSMTIPIGRRPDGTPIGCCMMGRYLEDAQLLGILYALEARVHFPHPQENAPR